MRKLHWSILKRLYRMRGRFGVYERLERRWLLDNRNWIDQQLLIRRPYEVQQIARCRQLVAEHRLEAFFDIGANFGLYSVLLSGEEGLAQIHAFEPLPRNGHQLSANLYLNGLDNRVQFHGFALGDQESQIDLFVDPHSTGVSTLLPPEARVRQDAYDSRVPVQVRAFDGVFAFQGLRALVKMDVEGAEFMALCGMQRFLAENHVALQVETTPQTTAQVDAFMAGAGYRSLGRLGPDAYFANC